MTIHTDPMRSEGHPVIAASCSIAIFAARETPRTLFGSLAGAVAAAPPDSVIDVLVNGNPELSRVAAQHVASMDERRDGPSIRVWRIALGDKAHAWNQHIHSIWPGTGTVFYIDGYVSLFPGAIGSMFASLGLNRDALGGTGLPSTGRSAEFLRNLMAKEGGFHGNFCCLTGPALEQFRERGIRLPLGIYRTDATIGSILSFGLHPARHRWDARRYIAVADGATWHTDPKHWWRLKDLKATAKRLLRQAQGRLENHAVREHLSLRKLDPADFPHSVQELVSGWIDRNPKEAGALLSRDPLMRIAWGRLREPRDWAQAEVPAELVAVSGNARRIGSERTR